jgi:small subunit ribosomal protein S11
LKVMVMIGEYGKQVKRMKIRVSFKGVFGAGREAVSAAISGPEGAEIQQMIGRVEDRTPVAIGGPRARKPRRM